MDKRNLALKADKGYIKAKSNISQDRIRKCVDIANASKSFELEFDKSGPYKFKYYRNGRFLLLGGSQGHVAAIDWVTKDLLCEFSVRESVHAVQWLHMPTMFAVSQNTWVHIYDKSGIELNVIKTMHRSTHLDFLDHHFLLASASDTGYVAWKDVSIGKDIASFRTKSKVVNLTHNPYNGLLVCSHPNGTVTMWSPNHNQPALSMLCHSAGVRAASLTIDGHYMATTSVDKTIKLWDLRNNYQCLKEYQLGQIPETLHFSQQGLLAVGCGKIVTIYNNVTDNDEELNPYLKHNVGRVISDVYFCNYEDILGVGHQGGFASLLVPGSGEPNFDSHESNPFMTKSQRKEMEVKMLLDKVPHELICLDPTSILKSSSR